MTSQSYYKRMPGELHLDNQVLVLYHLPPPQTRSFVVGPKTMQEVSQKKNADHLRSKGRVLEGNNMTGGSC